MLLKTVFNSTSNYELYYPIGLNQPQLVPPAPTGPNLIFRVFLKRAHLMTYIQWLWREQWTQDGVVVSDPINHQVFTQWHVSIWKSLPGCLGIQITLESISSLIMCLHFWRFMSILLIPQFNLPYKLPMDWNKSKALEPFGIYILTNQRSQSGTMKEK